jgi:amidase
MKRIDRNNPKYFLSPYDTPVTSIESGDEITIECHDTYTGQIRSPRDIRSQIDFSKLCPLTGPIKIIGAEPGDSIILSIKDITIDDQGIMVMAPNLGVLGERVARSTTKIIPIHDNTALFNDRISLQVQPMIGTIGVAPSGEPVRSYTPGDYGGNMDIKEVSTGAKVYLPVLVPGALIYVGDLHALQGDGELDGTGIEISGEVSISFELRKEESIPRPRILTEQLLIMVSSGRSLIKAIETAVSDMVDYLAERLNLEFDDAYRLTSAICDLRIGQIVNPRVTVYTAIPRRILKI